MKNIIHAKKWVGEFVIAHRLCPFAKAPFEAGVVRFCELGDSDTEAILESFWREVELIDKTDEAEISNSILVVPALSDSFEEYLDVFYLATDLIEMQDKSDKFQLASFHPDYVFEGTDTDDPTNYTNRSPMPFIHILRTEEVGRAIESHPDIGSVTVANQVKMRDLGEKHLREFLVSFK